MSLRTVGVGKWRNGTLEELLAELQEKQQYYNIPPDATIARVQTGSMYALEIIWIENGNY